MLGWHCFLTIYSDFATGSDGIVSHVVYQNADLMMALFVGTTVRFKVNSTTQANASNMLESCIADSVASEETHTHSHTHTQNN